MLLTQFFYSHLQAVTGRCFGDKDFRGGLENGILLCELLSSIRPGLVKKINRLPTPIAGLDNLSVFLRGCEELGLKGSQLFDPGDLQDTSTRPTAKGSDGSRKLKNVLITIYWLGRAANSCTSYNGPTLDLKEFEGLLSQMRKETEEAESPKRSIRDSGYIDCWDSERSDSLSPPRHGREDSFDSLDSFGSRSRQTPSPDVLVARRGSDSESDGAPHRKMPDVRKDDMLARRTSVSEPRTAVPFNQYLPNKSNQSGYLPTPLRKKSNDKEEGGRKSWSTATSPVGGDRPLRSVSMIDMRGEEEAALQPHSQVRHERMHNQYNKMKEEDDHWQDDLARWKNRRRSISQDLIKKEEERKMMERLMSGDTYTSQRRRSIKTYREIVEDKERREEELRQAYRKAKTPEEATAILQRYAQRFSISEAVLERLQLPKLLDRSISADPSFPTSPFPLSLSLSASPTTPDPFDSDFNGPMRYLRQQSVDGLLRVNGDVGSDDVPTTPESQGRDSPPHFQASPSQSKNSTVDGAVDAPSSETSLRQSTHASSREGSPVSTKAKETQDVTEIASEDTQEVQEEKVTESTPPSRPTSLPSVSVPVLPQAKRGDRWSWDPDEERKRQERWQQEQERMLQEKYQREQEKLKEEWEKAQKEVAEEERKYHEEERRILEETVTPLTPHSSALPSPSRGELSSISADPQDTIVRSLADWERKQELLESNAGSIQTSLSRSDCCSVLDWLSSSCCMLLSISRSGPIDNNMGRSSSKNPAACPPSSDALPPAPNRSVSGKKLCSSCGQPLGKGAAMIIETLSLYFHIHCFKCGVCKGQLGDTTTGTDVRIRNGLLNCHQCYIRSRSAGQPTTL
uniref:LIM and calponin homology domains 1 n=1 Tax=Oreochromis niloticus TaxID=8128 RepID=A0A669BI92_ORENI